MVNVWMVVFCTMLATALFGFVWHSMGMSEAHIADGKESLVVKEDIARLIVYRGHLLTKQASSTATTTPPSIMSTTTTTTTKNRSI